MCIMFAFFTLQVGGVDIRNSSFDGVTSNRFY